MSFVFLLKGGAAMCKCGGIEFNASVISFPGGKTEARLHCKKCGKELHEKDEEPYN